MLISWLLEAVVTETGESTGGGPGAVTAAYFHISQARLSSFLIDLPLKYFSSVPAKVKIPRYQAFPLLPTKAGGCPRSSPDSVSTPRLLAGQD